MNDPELLYTHPACKIYFNAEVNAVQTEWTGVEVESKALRLILDAIIEAVKKKETGIIIADARKMQAIGHEDQQWISENWYPRALDAGFRYEALVLAQYTFNEVTVKRIVRTYDDRKVKTGYFKSVFSAYDWVKNNFGDEEGNSAA